MASTNRTINVGPVTWTPSGGTALILTGIKSADYDEKIEVIKETADAELFNTVAAAVHFEPTMSLETINPYQLMTTVGGTRGSLEVTIRDAYNWITTAGGGYTITIDNAFLETRSQSYKKSAYGTQTLTFGAISDDGTSHPVSVEAL